MQPDKNFEPLVDSVRTWAEKSAEAARGGQEAPWLNFADREPLSFFDIEGIQRIFDRSDSNDAYIIARTQNPDTQERPLAVPKLSCDWIAAIGRDTRSRQRSRIRHFAHATARNTIDGQTDGALRVNTVDYLNSIMGSDR